MLTQSLAFGSAPLSSSSWTTFRCLWRAETMTAGFLYYKWQINRNKELYITTDRQTDRQPYIQTDRQICSYIIQFMDSINIRTHRRDSLFSYPPSTLLIIIILSTNTVGSNRADIHRNCKQISTGGQVRLSVDTDLIRSIRVGASVHEQLNHLQMTVLGREGERSASKLCETDEVKEPHNPFAQSEDTDILP